MATPRSPAEMDFQLAHINQSLSPRIISVSIALPIVATTAVTLRLIATRLKRVKWKAEDSVLVAALLATYALCTELVLCAHFGMGHHLVYILQNPKTTSLTSILKTQYAVEITWNVCAYLVKLSIILLLARLFATSTFPRFRASLQLIHVFLFLWTAASLFSVVFRCTPVKSYWDPNAKGTCLHTRAGRLIPAASSLFTDVILLVLAMRAVWPLKIPLQQKLAVLVTFSVGFLCLGASGIRLHYAVTISWNDGYDPTYTEAAFLVWACVEACMGIVCTCLPLLRPLFDDSHAKRLGGWLKESVLSRFIKEEPDTWWHPPPEEHELENCTRNDAPSGSERANSDWSFFSPSKHKLEVREEVISVKEIRGGRRSAIDGSHSEHV